MFDKNKMKEFLERGKLKEKEFLSTLNECVKGEESSREEDMNEHWDVKLVEEIKIDVKSIKRDSRYGDLNENIHWIEIKGVKDEGWLFGGKADYIAFELIDYWIVVERIKLRNFIIEKCKDKIKTDSPNDAIYKLYSRKGRNDVLTKAKTIDLMFLSEKIIPKS